MNPKFVEWLSANGYDAEALGKPENAKQRTHLEAAWKAETQPAPTLRENREEASAFDEKVEEYKANARRVKAIESITEDEIKKQLHCPEKIEQLQEFCKAAVANKSITPEKFKLSMLQTVVHSHGPLVYAPERPVVSNDVIEAAVCRSGQLDRLEKHYSEQTLHASEKLYRRGLGLHELIGLGATQNGWRGHSVKGDLRNAMRAAFHPVSFEASLSGPSTISVPGILSNVANKFLVTSWNSVEQAWRRISAIRSVSDFKTVTSYSLTGDLQYDKVAPGGKLKHGTLGEESYTNKADTYGKVLGIDRRDLVNDDLGAFIAVNRRLGRGGALKLNDVFWTEFLADASTFWTAGRGNYDDGTDTAFGADGLTAADVIWKAKTDSDGKPLGLTARLLLVPPLHSIPAYRLMNSQQILKDSNEGNVNPFQGMMEVVSSVYIANSSYTGYSTKAWYMLADPQEMPVIEVAFLNGIEIPTVEEVELSGDQLGMGLRAYHDFGVNKQEYRGGLKLKGEA